MIFHPAALDGVRFIELEVRGDARGSFARTFCEREFAAEGLETRYVQHNVSRTAAKGALRGMHFQKGGDAEVKVIRCLRGAIFDVLIDLRVGSPTFMKWQGFELTAEKSWQLYAPRGFAHGFQALTDDVEVSYLISAFYAPASEGGVRWDDPRFGIEWPMAPSVMNSRDQAWPDFDPAAAPYQFGSV